MKIYKEIKIDLGRYRAKLDIPEYSYTEDEKLKLTELYNLFEAGRLEEAIKYSENWSSEDRELILCEIWDGS
jgi:hypothetical protein